MSKGQGIRLAGKGIQGQGIRLAGQGWKTGVGSTLVALGGIGAAGSLGGDQVMEGVIGGAVLGGLGSALIAWDKRKVGKGQYGGSDHVNMHIVKKMKQRYKSKTHAQIKKMIHEHKHKMIHASDIFGADWKKKGKILIKAIEKHQKSQQGKGFLGDVGKFAKKTYKGAKRARDQGLKKLKQFANGKTKFKPSQLLSYSAAAIGLAGSASALIPGVDLISVPLAAGASLGLKSAGLALKTSGRGVTPAGAGRLSSQVKNYMKAHPAITKKLATHVHEKNQKGSGKWGRAAGALALAGAAASAGALGTLEYLKHNPSVAAKLALKGGVSIADKWLAGSGKPPCQCKKKQMKGGCRCKKTLSKSTQAGSGKIIRDIKPWGVSMTGSGKIKKDRYSVYHGYYSKTSGGLTKDAFILKGKKVISRRRSELGRKNQNFRKRSGK